MDPFDFPEMKPDKLPELASRSVGGSSNRNAIRVPRSKQAGWVQVRAMVRVAPPGEESWSLVELNRPHALIGRKPGCDITIAHNDLETSHVYLHFDENGCYAIDLRTRSGMRVNSRAVTHSAIYPGDVIEAGGYRIQLDGLIINGQPVLRGDYGPSPLSRESARGCVGVKLRAISGSAADWTINSRIAFVGRDASCAVSLSSNPAASRIHGVLIRSSNQVHFVDLISRGTHVNGEHIHNTCCELFHSDVISIGRRGLVVQREDHIYQSQTTNLPELASRHQSQETQSGRSEEVTTVLASLLNRIQTQHDAALDRQNELQVAMAQLLRQVQNEQARILETHLGRIQQMDSEIAELKAQIAGGEQGQRRLTAPTAERSRIPTEPGMAPPTQAESVPQKPAKPINFKKIKTRQSAEAQDSPEYTAAWLMDKVSQLESEQTSTWRELLGRIRGK
jgi:pSer/pThr/pTyr-binding forkhead associated (FHA) protein